MAYATTKKQNRILCIALVVLLAAAAILIAVTGSANRKKEEVPPVDNKTQTEQSEPEKGKKLSEPDAQKQSSEDALSGENAVSAGKKPAAQDQANTPNRETLTDDPGETKTEEKSKTGKDKTTSAEGEADAAEVSAPLDDVLPDFIAPVNGALMKEHSVDVPVFSYTMNDYRTHTGVDLACAAGASVVAPADGTVGQVWEDPMMGISMNLIHKGGAVTYYKGLSAETMDTLSAGKEVRAGEVIASVGDTALIECGDEPHLHFEMSVNGESVDPAEYIHFERLSETYED